MSRAAAATSGRATVHDALRRDQNYFEGAGAVDAVDAGHFDVGSGGGARDGGDGCGNVGAHLCDAFGHGFDNLPFVDNTQVIIRNERESAAAFGFGMAQHNGAG